jgi:hypothetical protein
LGINLIEETGKLPDGGLVGQSLDLAALERIGQSLVEGRLQIDKPSGRVVFPKIRFALARHSDIDRLDREAEVAQMKAEIVAHTNRVNPYDRETRTELVEETDDLTASVLTAPGAHRDDLT